MPQGGRHQIGTLAGFGSEQVAGFRLECMAGFVGIRSHVTRRKLSGGTRSDLGRDCRDAFLGLAKTCAKLEIAFWDYLGARLAVPGCQAIPPLPQIIRARAQSP